MAAPKLNLRLAHIDDLPRIVEIYNSIIPGRMVTADLDAVTVDSKRPWFDAHQVPNRPLWVAVDDAHEVCAWASFDTFKDRAAYDGTVQVALYLAESHRGRGIGGWLLEEVATRAPALGVHSLTAYIFAHNAPSLALFKRHQFAQWGYLPRIAVLDGVERDLVIMGRRVAP